MQFEAEDQLALPWRVEEPRHAASAEVLRLELMRGRRTSGCDVGIWHNHIKTGLHDAEFMLTSTQHQPY